MKSIILVGGEGTRLRPLTYSVVKSMVPVVNRPFIEHVIAGLALHNVNETVLAMGYKPDSIFAYFKSDGGTSINLTYSLEEKPLGTAGAVKNAAGHVEGTFFVLNGDVFSDIDYTGMLDFHRSNGAAVTIALTHVDDPTKFGVVESDDTGRVKRFIEKPKWEDVTSHWINAGVYILEPSVLDYMPDGEFYMFEKGVFPSMLNKGERVFAYPSQSYWIDMGTPEKYHQLNNDILSGKCTSPLFKTAPILIDPTAEVHASAQLTAPIMIGADCIIGKNVRLTGPVIVGKGCNINDNSRLQDSVLWDHITIGKAASVTNCIIASGAKIKDKARLEGQTVNHDAPAGTGGK
jgi:mannose-1-phosphate guanylyltransferase